MKTMFRMINTKKISIYFLCGILTLYACLRYFSLFGLMDRSSTNNSKEIIAHDYEDTNHIRFDVGKVKLNFLPQFKSPCFLEKLPDSFPGIFSEKDSIYSKSAYVRNRNSTKFSRFGKRIETYMAGQPQGVLINDTNDICGLQHKCRIRCLPYFMLLGMAKSGTTDFYARIRSHALVFPAVNKELFYWTQFRFQINATLGDYSNLFDNSLQSVINHPQIDEKTGEDYYPYAFGDFTSVTFTDDVWWREHPGNKGLLEPKYLKIHELYKSNPNVKLIVILRNPTSRLYSSYNMFRAKANLDASPEDFHARVVKSIEWWHNCTVIKGLPRRACAYGSPPEMPTVVSVLKSGKEKNRWYGPTNVANYSGEIRRGLYPIFVKDWYSVFPKDQILLIKTEEYTKDTLKYFNNIILPFLNISKVEHDTERIAQTSHGSRSYLPMFPETKQLLDIFYKPFKQEMADYLGDDKWLWKDM